MISIAPRETQLDRFRPDVQAVMDMYSRSTLRGPSVFDGSGQSKMGQTIFNGQDEGAAFRGWNAVAISSYATIAASVRPKVGRIARRRVSAKKQRQSWSIEQRTNWERHYSQMVGEASIDNVETLPEHELAILLDKVNDQQNWEMHAQLTFTALRIYGEAYWYMPANGLGLDGSTLPGAMMVVPRRWLHPKVRNGALEGWTIRDPNAMEAIDALPDEVLRIYYPDPDSPGRALSPARLYEGFLIGSEALTVMRNTRFERGGDSAVMLVPEDGMDLQDDEVKKLLWKLRDRANLANTGLPLLIPPGLKPHNTGQTNRDLEIIASDEQLMRSVFASHGLSPMIAGISKDLNRATSQAALQQGADLTLNPALRFLAGVLTEQIARRWGTDIFVFFDPISVTTIEDAIARINTRAAHGAITPSQVSVAMGGEPDESPEANVPYMAAGMTPLYQPKGVAKPKGKPRKDHADDLLDDE